MNLILTNKGEELASNGFLTGVFPKITKVVFGDGNGINVIPSKTMTTLIHPIQEGVGTALARISNPNGLYIYTQIPASVGGFTVREIGLFTADDILIAVGGNFEKVKPPVSDSIEKLDFYITVPLSSAQEITVEFSNDNIYADQSAVDIIHNSIELRRLEVLTLQGQMPTKVSISNIIDNVTSSNIDKPLSAKQGKVLKDLVDAKQAIINNNSLNINKIDVNAGIEINSLLVDTDTFIVDDGGTNTIRKSYISRIWTYISSKLTGAISTVLTSNLTAGKTVVTDVNGKLGVSSITTTELGYLAGVGSSIQTQINGKAPTNQVMYLGNSALPINRASAALSLLGVSIDGNAGTASLANKASTLASSGGDGTGMTFSWSGQGGQPPWLWGGSNGTNMYVYNPSNFNVSYANSAGVANSITTTAAAWGAAQLSTGEVGTYAFLGTNTLNSSIAVGSTYAGSSLYYTGVNNETTTGNNFAYTGGNGGTATGTWKAMGHCVARSDRKPSTLFLRIS